MFGLVAAGRLGLATDGVEGALAKIHRVLPDAIRSRVEALESTLGFTTARRDDAADRRRRRAPARRRDPPATAHPRQIPHVRGRRIAARAQPARPRRPLRALVPRCARPRPGRPPHVPRRPHRRRGARRGGGRRAARTASTPSRHVRRSLARVPWPWEVEVLLDLSPERGGRASAGDARRACARGRRNAPADARQLARLDGRRARRPWLRASRSGARTSSDASVAALARRLLESASSD